MGRKPIEEELVKTEETKVLMVTEQQLIIERLEHIISNQETLKNLLNRLVKDN